jgi:hypothetical protein
VTGIAELLVRSPVEPWQQIGLRVVDGVSWIGGISLRFSPPDVGAAPQLSAWTLVGSPATPPTIDGLTTTYLDDFEPQSWEHPLGATMFDHVVIMTSSVQRTCADITRVTGEPLKRVREAGPVRQGFHRLGPMIVEVVESDRVTSAAASFWGFVFVVDDIHEAAARLGPDVLTAPKPAVQNGRYIASFRATAGLGLPIALMSPHVRGG